MNERIDKLLVKAGAYFGGEGVVYDTFDPKKFAELIVTECVAKTMEVGEQNDEPIEPIWVANCIAHCIFKHFGVEE